MRKGQWLRCQNLECAAEIEITKDSIPGEFRITCCCGSPMKRPFNKPVLARLSIDSSTLATLFGRLA